MRVALIIPSFYPAVVYGGSTFASYDLTKEAANNGMDIWVSTTNANGDCRLEKETNSYLQQDKFKVKYYNEEIIKYFSARMLVGLWRDIKMADVVHLQAIFSYPTPIALLYSFLQNKKVLFSPRGSFSKWSFSKAKFLKKTWINFLIKPFVKSVTWHATSVKEQDEIKLLFPKAKVKVISDGTYVKSASLEKVTENYIAALGRLHPVKGYDLLIQAMPGVLAKHPTIKLKIAGDDEGEKEQLQRLVKDLKLENVVEFVGSVKGSEKTVFLQRAKCLLMPSHTENFGIVAVEAMAQGTAVIASNNTPWKIIEERKAGFWISNEPTVIAQTILKLLAEKEEELQKNASLLAKEYDWGHIAKQYQQVLEELCNE